MLLKNPYPLVPWLAVWPRAYRCAIVFGRVSTGPLSARVLAATAWGVAATCLLPLVYLLVRTLQIGPGIGRILGRPRIWQVGWNSLALTLAVTVTAVCVGTSLAWLTTRTDLRGRRFWSAVTILPLVLPSYVGAFALIAALGPNGMLQNMLAPLGVERLPSIYGFPGAWLALTLFTYPYVQLSVRAGLRGLDPSLEEAARSLGLSSAQIWRRVTLPYLRPAMAAGALLVALYTLSDFGAVALLQFNAFTREIYVQYTAALDRSAAAVLGVMLVGLTLFILWGEYRLRGRGVYYRSGPGTARRPAVIALGRWQGVAIGWCVIVAALALGIPLLVIGYWLTRPAALTSSWAGVWTQTLNSVSASGLAAITAVAAAFPVVLYSIRRPGRSSRWAERCGYLGHALPGVVVALSLVFLSARHVPRLYQTGQLLILAYAVLFLPLALSTLRAALLNLSPRLEEAAAALGATPLRILHTIILPLVRPGIWMGVALVFLTVMKELPATLILGPTGFHTLATRIWGATEEALFTQAAPSALILVLVSAFSLWIILQQEESVR